MSTTIPLVKDILDTYPDAKMNEYVDSKMVEMYNIFSSQQNGIYPKIPKYTNENIYNYIKFINITCLDTSNYKHVIKYINSNNISFFDTLFNIYDIQSELLPLLPYNTIVNYHRFNDLNNTDVKARWIIHNMEWVKRHKSDILDSYIKFKIENVKYYSINNIIFSNHRRINLKNNQSVNIIYHICDMAKHGYLDLIKYVINTIAASYGNNINRIIASTGFSAGLIFCKTVSQACEFNNLNVVKYIIKFLKDNNVLHVIKDQKHFSSNTWLNKSVHNFTIFKYLATNTDLKPYVCLYKDVIIYDILMTGIDNGDIEMIDYMIESDDDVNHINLISHGNLKTVKHLINKGVDILKYGEKSIQAFCHIHIDEKVYEYIIDLYAPLIIGNVEKINSLLITTMKTNNKYALSYIINKYITVDYIINEISEIDGLLEIAYDSGQCTFIEEVMHNMFIRRGRTFLKKSYIKFSKILSIIDYNNEDECIHFISFLFLNNIYIKEVKKLVDICIIKGYIKIIIFIMNDLHNMSHENITDCIVHSHSEDPCIHIISEIIKKRKLKNSELIKIVNESVKKGYLRLINNICKNREIKLPLNDLLKEACKHEHFDIVKYLVNLGSDVNYVPIALLLDCKSNENVEIIKYMVESGLNVQKIILHMVNFFSKATPSDVNKYFDIIKHIYDGKFEDINSGNTLKLFKVICHNKEYDIIKYMLNKGLSTKSCIELLHNAINEANENVVKILVEYIGPNQDMKISNKVIKYLCVCNVNYTNIIKHISCYANISSLNPSVLFHVCKNERLELLVHLIENGINYKENINTLLRISAKYGYVDIVKYLVEIGANIKFIDIGYYDRELEKYLDETEAAIRMTYPGEDIYEYDSDYYTSDHSSDCSSDSDSDCSSSSSSNSSDNNSIGSCNYCNYEQYNRKRKAIKCKARKSGNYMNYYSYSSNSSNTSDCSDSDSSSSSSSSGSNSSGSW